MLLEVSLLTGDIPRVSKFAAYTIVEEIVLLIKHRPQINECPR